MPILILAAILLVASVFLYLPYRQDILSAYQRLENIERQTLQTVCGPIELAIWGAGEPVLISHGITGGSDQGLGLAEAHLSRGTQAIAPSRLGYLGTPLPENASPAAQADAYVCLLDALKIDKVIMPANSAGGPSAILNGSGPWCWFHPQRPQRLRLPLPS